MTEELQADYLDRYEGVQSWIHQVSQFDDSSAVNTTYLGKTDKTSKNFIKAQEQFFKYGSLHKNGDFTRS